MSTAPLGIHDPRHLEALPASAATGGLAEEAYPHPTPVGGSPNWIGRSRHISHCSRNARFRDGSVRVGWDTCGMSLQVLDSTRHVARDLDRRDPVKRRPRTGWHRPGPDTEVALDAPSP
jgi:hypothetical protein